MDESTVFLELTKHLVTCQVVGCQTCYKIFGEKRPDGLIRARFETTVKKWRKKRGLDTSTPEEVE